MSTPRSRREQLGQELEHLRRFAGLSGRALAGVLSISQSTISRVESGRAPLSRDEVSAWADATDADAPTRDRLFALVDAALREEASWRGKLGEGRTHLQDEMRGRETGAHTVRNFQPTVVPGLLQTPEYAHYVIPRADIDNVMDRTAAAAARLQRQQTLFNGVRQFEFLIGEAALHWPSSAPELLAAQLDRIVALAPLAAVTIAVLPLGEPIDAVPWSNFVIYDGDEPFVSIELVHRPETVTDPRQIDLYRRIYDQMWQRATTSSDAVALIQRLAGSLRACNAPT
ncbi:MAG TPA: helix-turn-helix transcriptional regulator [Pseudonocardiaceae bacterium]|jgi:transcriptional regulator with XRE-family HTH domain|nr:helix-turn-helix transcriptional regulator [Pseudonocardiaceae bacterium]